MQIRPQHQKTSLTCMENRVATELDVTRGQRKSRMLSYLIHPLLNWIGAVGWQETGDNCHVRRTCDESVEINLGLGNRLNWEHFCDHCAQPPSYFVGRGRN